MTDHSESLILSTVTSYRPQKPLLQYKAKKKQRFSVLFAFSDNECLLKWDLTVSPGLGESSVWKWTEQVFSWTSRHHSAGGRGINCP